MSEWIDFAVYALQLVMLGVLIPRQSVQFTIPAIIDRDPAWPAAHPEVIAVIGRSRWFLHTFYAWTALSIGVLAAVRVGWLPPLGSADTPSWEALKNTHGSLMIVGLLGYLGCFLYWTRWVATSVPLAAKRSATLKPRAASDYVPSGWRLATELLTVAQLALWLALPALGFGGGRRYWGSFAFVVAITVLLRVLAYYTAHRRPNYGDRLFGEAYRRMELRVYYLMQLVAPLAIAALTFGKMAGIDLARPGQLAIILFSCVLGFAFLRLRPAESGGPSSGRTPFTPERGSAA